jgi:hypothetical protein
MADQSYSSSRGSILFSSTGPTEASLTGATVKAVQCAGSRRFTLTRLSVVISDAVTSSGSVVLTAFRWKTPDNGGGDAVTIGTVTLASDAAAGSVWVREFSTDIQPGEAIAVTVSTAAAGGGAAGNAVIHIEGYESDVTLPEIAAGATASSGADKADAGTGQLFRVSA